MRRWITAVACAGTVLVSGCASVFGGGRSFSALQASCQAQTDYGADAQAVHSTLVDAYVAYRHGRVSQADYCGFARDIESHYRARTAGGPDAARAWAEYFNAQRVKAIDWRAQVDPTLRGG
ncbi:MAG: hypothetical protein ACTHKH_03455 [Trinickia sp.]